MNNDQGNPKPRISARPSARRWLFGHWSWGIFLTWVLGHGALASAAERLVPLNTLSNGTYHSFVGGLYAGGKNEPWGAHADALRRVSAQVQPLDRDGKPSPNGEIVLAGIGASVCRQIFNVLEREGAQTPGLNPAVVFVNCALGGQDVNKIADPAGRYWQEAVKTLAARGVSPAQVQVVWYQSDELRDSRDDFPGRPQRLKDSFTGQMRLLKQHFPNVRLCYHSARHTTSFMPNDEGKIKHAEPRPYHVGWAVKWLIEDQSAGKDNLRFEGDDAVAPLVAWATYFWTDGDQPRHDGYHWTHTDNVKDGVHLTESAQKRVAKDLTDFWSRDTFAKAWFASNAAVPQPKPEALAPGGARLRRAVATSDPQDSTESRSTTGPVKPSSNSRKDAGLDEPAWIVNGNNKMPKLERLLATTENVRVVVLGLDGEQIAEIKDVFHQHTDLNKVVGSGQFRLEFYDKDGKPIKKTMEVGEILRLK